MYFIGYDIGSSSVKATLLNGESNQALASAQHPRTEMSMIAHKPGWAEQNPEDWWSSIVRVTKDLLHQTEINKEEIKAIGISYQMHGLVLVDKDLHPLRPAIIWCDSRAVEIGEQAYNYLGAKYCQQRTLNSPGNFTASKLAWVAQNEPEIFEKVFKAMLPGDYIAMKLSGIVQTTYAGLSEGVMYDFKEDNIAKEVLQYFQIGLDLIPEIVPTFGDQSQLSKRSAQELGLNPGTKITYRAGDQPNNALSLNVLNPGELAATAGTSGVIYGVTDRLNNDPASRVNAFAHVNHAENLRRIGILLCINGTGILNAWARRNMGHHSYEEMNELASKVSIGAEGLTMLPFGNGAERILKNKNIGAHLEGLQFNVHQQGHVYRAIQEGIACSMRYGIDIMRSMDLDPTTIKAGRANLFLSPLFQRAIANLSNATIELYDTDGAQGAARGAGIGLKYYDEKTAFNGLKLLKRISPNPQKQEEYEETYRRWRRLLAHHLAAD